MSLFIDKAEFIRAIEQINAKFLQLDRSIEQLNDALSAIKKQEAEAKVPKKST